MPPSRFLQSLRQAFRAKYGSPCCLHSSRGRPLPDQYQLPVQTPQGVHRLPDAELPALPLEQQAHAMLMLIQLNFLRCARFQQRSTVHYYLRLLLCCGSNFLFFHQGYLGLPRHRIGSLAFACRNSSRWVSVRIGTVLRPCH